MIVYIASPYTLGGPVENVRRQIDAAEVLRAAGHLPIVPLLSHYWHDVYPHDWEYWMAMCLEWLEQADAVVRLPGGSKGADSEVAKAKELEIPIYHSVAEFLEGDKSESQEVQIALWLQGR